MPYVLIHGAGFAASCWDRLVPLLDDEAHAVDLPGRGTRPAELSTVTVRAFADAVVEEILDRDLTDVVLVGHSLAGITLPRVAARVPDRLRHLAFVSCVVPPHGVAVLDVLDGLSPAVAEVAAQIDGEVLSGDGHLHPDLVAAIFCNDMDDQQRAFTLANVVPESLDVLGEPADLTGLGVAVPRTYVRLLQDESLTPEAQTRMAATVAGAGDLDIVDIDAAHMVMISRPDALAAVLNAL